MSAVDVTKDHFHRSPDAGDAARRAASASLAGPASTGSPEHDEWLLDEALGETFPASDPICPARCAVRR